MVASLTDEFRSSQSCIKVINLPRKSFIEYMTNTAMMAKAFQVEIKKNVVGGVWRKFEKKVLREDKESEHLDTRNNSKKKQKERYKKVERLQNWKIYH